MKFTCLFIAVFGLTLIVGCSEDPASTNSTSQITYFDVGSYWVYDVISYDTSGVIISTLEDSVWIAKVDTASSKLTITYSNGASYTYDSIGMKSASTGSYWYYSNPHAGDTCWDVTGIPVKVDSTTTLGNVTRNVMRINQLTTTNDKLFVTTTYKTTIHESYSGRSLSRQYEEYVNSIGMITSVHHIMEYLNDYPYVKRINRNLKRYHIEKIATLYH